jgi:hypothetical protein
MVAPVASGLHINGVKGGKSFLCCGLIPGMVDGNQRAFRHKAFGHGPPYPARATRYNRMAVLQPVTIHQSNPFLRRAEQG